MLSTISRSSMMSIGQRMTSRCFASQSKDRLIIFDTTLRDGEQSPGATLNINEKIQIAKHLSLMGVDVWLVFLMIHLFPRRHCDECSITL